MIAPSAGSEPAGERKLLAPIWHTVGLIVLILGTSAASYLTSQHFVSASPEAAVPNRAAMLVTYAGTLVLEWVLFLYVYLGEKFSRGTRIAERVGGRWSSARDFWRDIGIALALWVVLTAFGGIVGHLLHPKGMETVLKLLPRDATEIIAWLLVCVSAGFCEEYVFRGYLQEQFRLLTGKVWIAVALQAIVFGFGHGYQGVALMLTIIVYGLLIGATAAWRKSLRPVMIAHGWLDFFQGFAFYVAHALHQI
ncbi:MAG TPA: type II CAAX endopeptidase family protein [Candidatus Angelobacter sp.]|nr:type II CAAX endopeptidase family protein [Candidatus Angelobacter sp.]